MFIKKNNISDHYYFMGLALLQAHKSLGNTKTNPSVGCVIVKNKSVISLASTSFNGRPHAEHNAINFNKKEVKSSDLYVTLEPCSNYGKTPPCVKYIIKNKIKKVFFSVKDPDIRSYNQSSHQFKKKKIKVNKGILKSEIDHFYRSYFKFKNNNLPFVTGKIAVSKDLYTVNKKNKWITNKFSRGRVHLMRSQHDCIVTSSKTIIKDNPILTCRIPGLEHTSPIRIILDKKLKISINSNVVLTANKHKTIIFFNDSKHEKIKEFNRLGVKMIKFPLDNNHNFNLKNLLNRIKLMGFSRIFLEAGSNLTSNFLKENLIDDFHLFMSNKKIKKHGLNSFKENMKFLFLKKSLKLQKINLFGEKLLTYNLK